MHIFRYACRLKNFWKRGRTGNFWIMIKNNFYYHLYCKLVYLYRKKFKIKSLLIFLHFCHCKNENYNIVRNITWNRKYIYIYTLRGYKGCIRDRPIAERRWRRVRSRRSVATSKVAQTEKFMPPLQRSRYPRR